MCILTCWRDSMDEPKSINGNGTAYFGWASSMTQLGGKFIHAASVFVAGRARASDIRTPRGRSPRLHHPFRFNAVVTDPSSPIGMMPSTLSKRTVDL